MPDKAEGILAIFAALLVLSSAILYPLLSAGIAVLSLAGLGVYHLTRPKK